MTSILLFYSIAPAVTLAFLMSRFARSGEHRTRWTPWVAFALGALMVGMAILFQAPLIPLLSHVGGFQVLFLAFIIAGVVEELVKLGALRLAVGSAIPTPRSAITLGVCAGCGFAAVENLICVYGVYTTGGDPIAVAISRSLTAVPAHAAFGAVMGFCLSRPSLGKVGRYGTALLMPAFLHGWFNAPQLWAIQAGIASDGRFSLPVLAAIWVLVALTMDIARRESNPFSQDELDADAADLLPLPITVRADLS